MAHFFKDESAPGQSLAMTVKGQYYIYISFTVELLVIGVIGPWPGANPALKSTPYSIKLYRARYKPFHQQAVLYRHGTNLT